MCVVSRPNFGVGHGLFAVRGFILGLLMVGITATATQADDISSSGSEHLVVPPGTYDNAYLYDDSTMEVGDGVNILGFVNLRWDNEFIMTGGTVGDYVYVSRNTCTVRISGGTVGTTVINFGASKTYLSGGTIRDLQLVNESTGYVSGGTINNKIYVSGGMTNGVADGISTLHLSGGDIVGGLLQVNDDADVYIYADAFGSGYQAGDVLTASDLTTPIGDSKTGTHFDLTYADQTQTSFDFYYKNDDEWTGSLYLMAPEPAAASAFLLSGLVLIKRHRSER